MPDSNETIFIGTMLRIKKFNGFRINPNGLGFFEPNSMFLEIGSVLVLVPFESHIISVFYSIYTVNSKVRVQEGKLDQAVGRTVPCSAKTPSQLISLDFLGSGLHAASMKILLLITAVQALNLLVFAWFNRMAGLRILVLRQQPTVLKRKSKKPMLKNRDRLFWSLVSKIWRDWKSELILVRPETVVEWRKRKFRELWSRMSQVRTGRPAIPDEHIDLIRRISSDHPEYGEDRIALELEVKFGIRHACSTVRRYMLKRLAGPRDSQAWRSFLKNQAKAIWYCGFFVQHTIGFRVLYVFLIMELASRKVIHVHVTGHPRLEWTKQQIRNACFDEQPKFLLHDNDGKFGQHGRPLRVEFAGKEVSCRAAYDVWLWQEMGIRGVPIPYSAVHRQNSGPVDIIDFPCFGA